jgi:hypothetical protein
MKNLLRLISFSIFAGFHGASVFASTIISVASWGAKCDGITDDTSAIQEALDAAAAAGGGTVTLPKSTCLLNSFHPSSHPWKFYNLHVPSGVTLHGVTGSKLLQGPGGRQDINNVPGATWIENTVVAVGNDYANAQFQNSGSNGGFYSLQAMIVGSPSVTLSTAAEAANFSAGDYVAIYEYTSGDVLPAQMSQVTNVNAASGDLTLADSVIRPFVTPSIAKVTSLAAHNIAITNVIIQGAVPLQVTETFLFSASNDQFLSDTSVFPSHTSVDCVNPLTMMGAYVCGMVLNTVEHFTFTGNTIAAINGGYINQELCQRDSQNGVWTGNTFNDITSGFGEYAANITMTNNHIYLHPDGISADGVSLGGMNVKFRGNDVHTIGDQTQSPPFGSIVTDVDAPADYLSYTGNIQITNNTIQCVADGNNCLLLMGNGSVASGNIITATGWATGVYVADAHAKVTDNTIQIGSGTGVLVYTSPSLDAVPVTGNTLSGTGPCGIYRGSLPAPPGYRNHANSITGFTSQICVDPH